MVEIKAQEDVFDRQKKQTLSGIDHSKKGSFDKPIDDLMMYINALPDYFTTSSCSGRIIVFSEGDKKKKGCRWLLTSHEIVDAADVIKAIQNEKFNESSNTQAIQNEQFNESSNTQAIQNEQFNENSNAQAIQSEQFNESSNTQVEDFIGQDSENSKEMINKCSGNCYDTSALPAAEDRQARNITFKYESFILHLQSRTLEGAQEMLKVALGCGYRNSGIVIGKKKKFMVAVRSTHGLEVPLVFASAAGVSNEYIEHLVALANEKLNENFVKVDKFFGEVKKTFPT